MDTLILLFIFPIIGLALIVVTAIWATNTLVHRAIGHKHLLMDEILTSGDVPDVWSKRFLPKLSKLRRIPADTTRLGQLEAEARAYYIRQLDRLIEYAQTTPLVADEETRAELLAQLHTVRADWLRRPAELL